MQRRQSRRAELRLSATIQILCGGLRATSKLTTKNFGDLSVRGNIRRGSSDAEGNRTVQLLGVTSIEASCVSVCRRAENVTPSPEHHRLPQRNRCALRFVEFRTVA